MLMHISDSFWPMKQHHKWGRWYTWNTCTHQRWAVPASPGFDSSPDSDSGVGTAHLWYTRMGRPYLGHTDQDVTWALSTTNRGLRYSTSNLSQNRVLLWLSLSHLVHKCGPWLSFASQTYLRSMTLQLVSYFGPGKGLSDKDALLPGHETQ